MYSIKSSIVALAIAVWCAGCTGVPVLELGEDAGVGSAAIVGRVVSPDGTGKALTAQGTATPCPEVRVLVNGAPVSIDFDSDCTFVIDGVQPSPLVTVRVELPELGVAGTVELSNVASAELIEITVVPASDSLSVTVDRRATPAPPSGELPSFIDGNNVSIQLAAGFFPGDLTVQGNNFTLTGVAGVDCSTEEGWTVIGGAVVVNGNNAVFRNIRFAKSVTLRGNNARFINCCFAGQLVVFGNNTDVAGDSDQGDDDDDQGDDDDEDDDGDNGRGQGRGNGNGKKGDD